MLSKYSSFGSASVCLPRITELTAGTALLPGVDDCCLLLGDSIISWKPLRHEKILNTSYPDNRGNFFFAGVLEPIVERRVLWKLQPSSVASYKLLAVEQNLHSRRREVNCSPTRDSRSEDSSYPENSLSLLANRLVLLATSNPHLNTWTYMKKFDLTRLLADVRINTVQSQIDNPDNAVRILQCCWCISD